MADRFLIAPYDQNSGQQTNYRPWLIPDEAFAELTNAYVFRGRTRKRFGSRWLGNTQFESRLRIQVGVTAGGSLAGNVRTIAADAGMPTAPGQAFSVNNIIFTVVSQLAGPQQMLRSDGLLAPATYDLTTSAFNITGTGAADGTAVYFYPGFPVMGLLTFEDSAVNNEPVYAFDTRYAYQYTTGWTRLSAEAVAGAAVWTGNDAQFFWSATWTGTNAYDRIFFVTNYNAAEPNFMRYLFTGTWNNFRPAITGANFLDSARILVPFKNRLVALNTIENEAGTQRTYVNRARYSQVGSPLDVNAWRQDIPGRGSGIDAPTTEQIITCEFIKDRLIVYFEKSTWELAYTGNQAYPFAWQQINTELGAESTFSVIPFDKVALGVGNVGIHQCNGSNVERLDQKIPDTVFAIHNADSGVERVYGIRDYFVEMVYWTFPSSDTNSTQPYPNRVLIYNYKTGTWAFNDDSITCFGYRQPQTGITWDSTVVTWDDPVPWDSGSLQSRFRQVVAGNQEGYTFIVDADTTTNAPVLQITNIVSGPPVRLTVINHNLRAQEYIYIQDATYSDFSNGLNGQIFQVINVFDANTIDLDPSAVFTGTYTGGGVISRVSKINIKTKEYNFYIKQGRNACINKVDFMVDKTAAGQINVDFYASTSFNSLLTDSTLTGTLLGTGALDTFAYPTVPFEAASARVWHPVYFQADGECIQIQLTMSDAQMRNTDIRVADFQLHAMCIYAQATSYRFQ